MSLPWAPAAARSVSDGAALTAALLDAEIASLLARSIPGAAAAMPAAVAATLSLLPVGRQGRNVVGEGLGSGVPLGLCGQSGRLGWLNQLRHKILQPGKAN